MTPPTSPQAATRHAPRARLRVMIQEYGSIVGSLGSTSGQTVMVALLPVLMAEYAPSAFMIGLAIGAEGVFALFVPYWAGAWSDALPDRLAERFGRRSFFLLLTAPIMAGALVAAPLLDGYWSLFAIGMLFFGGLHAYLTPLWALMVDAVPDDRRGRVHGARGALHAAGIGYGLVASGLLFALWRPLPFLLGAVLILVTTGITMRAVRAADRATGGLANGAAQPDAQHRAAPGGPSPADAAAAADAAPAGGLAMDPQGASSGDDRAGAVEGGWLQALRRPSVRLFLIANAFWTGSIDGIRPYVFLFALTVMGITVAETSLVLTFLLVGLALGAVVLGRLSDHIGRRALLVCGILLTSGALFMGVFLRDPEGAIIILALAGVGAATLIALPFPLFVSLVGERGIGRSTGLYILSVGIARVAAPMMVGAAIDYGARHFPETQGYPLMWPMAAAMALLSVPFLLWSFRSATQEGVTSDGAGTARAAPMV